MKEGDILSQSISIIPKVVRKKGFVPINKTGISTIPKPEIIKTTEIARDGHLYDKKRKTGKFTLKPFKDYLNMQRLGYFTIDENGLYDMSSVSLPKIFPSNLSQIILSNLINQFKECEGMYEKLIINHTPTDYAYDINDTPCIEINENGNFVFSGIKFNGGSLPIELFNTENLILNTKNCYGYLTGTIIKKMLDILAKSHIFCYPFKNGSPIKGVEGDALIIKNMFNTYVKKNLKKQKDFVLYDELNPSLRSIFAEYYDTTSKKVKSEIKNKIHTSSKLNSIITVKKLRKYYKKFYNEDEKIINERLKDFTNGFKLKKNQFEVVSYFIAKLNINLDITNICILANLKNNKIPRKRGKKTQLKKPKSQMTQIEKNQQKEIELNKEIIQLNTSVLGLNKPDFGSKGEYIYYDKYKTKDKSYEELLERKKYLIKEIQFTGEEYSVGLAKGDMETLDYLTDLSCEMKEINTQLYRYEKNKNFFIDEKINKNIKNIDYEQWTTEDLKKNLEYYNERIDKLKNDLKKPEYEKEKEYISNLILEKIEEKNKIINFLENKK
jgi:hypothetical protein